MKIKKIILSAILLLVLIVFIKLWTPIKTLYKIRVSELEITLLQNDEKEIYFFPMMHVAKEKFYVSVREEIEKYKNDGAILFYEQIKGGKDLTLIDSLKLSKIRGGIGNSTSYLEVFKEELGWKDLVAQDNSSLLGIVNNKDYNVDIDAVTIVNSYEEKYGKILLTKAEIKNKEKDEDLHDGKKLNTIIIDDRNKLLATKINNSKSSKIIVIYGAAHEKGTIKELKKLNKNWKIRKLETK